MLINFDKIRYDNGIKASLKDEFFEMFIQNVGEYFNILESEFNKTPLRINPSEALNIISMLAGFKYCFISQEEWERLTLKSLGVLRRGVVSDVFGKFEVFFGIGQVTFTIHNLSLIAPNIKPFMNGLNKILIDNLSKYLDTTKIEDLMTTSNYEVIAGLSGPLRYLLDFPENHEMVKMAEKIVDLFVKRSKEKVVAEYKVTGWHHYPSEMEASFMQFEAPNGVVNYGLSHGMAGPLVALSMAYKNGIYIDGLEDTINNLISEYMGAYYYVNDIIHWPGMITLEQRMGVEEIDKMAGKMSWCYSSVGILRALYMASDFTNNEEVRQFAVKEYLKIAKMDMTDYLLTQPIVCHGHAGTAAVINAMYLDTGIPEFLQRAIEMAEVCTQFSSEKFFENQIQIHKNADISLRAQLHEYLEGYTGLLQSILSIIKGEPNENEKRLLIV
jgi:hypothetical protein